MTMVSEDPTILVVGLVLLGTALLVAMKITQRGVYLVRAGAVFGLAVLVMAIDWFWVTDDERIAKVVDGLRWAVYQGNVQGVLDHLAPDARFGRESGELSPELTRAMIQSTLANASFDFVRVTQLHTSVAPQARRGSADFRVMAKGRVDTAIGGMTVGSADSEWSLGFSEVEPGIWKVNRITPVSLPDGALPRMRGSASAEAPVVHPRTSISTRATTRAHGAPKPGQVH